MNDCTAPTTIDLIDTRSTGEGGVVVNGFVALGHASSSIVDLLYSSPYLTGEM